MKRAQSLKDKCKAAYLRVAATYAMVEVKRVVTSLVQHEEKLRAAQDILPNRFTTSDLEKALGKNRREEAAAKSETQSMVQRLHCTPQAVE